MPINFFYAAYSYLDEWMRKDSLFHSVLAYENSAGISDTAGRECLVKVATYYSVARTLRNIEEEDRLQSAYDALLSTEPPTRQNVVQEVEAFTKILGDKYKTTPLSAASKFLWMRFRSPVVIYDSLACEYLVNKECGFKYEGYSTYCAAWRLQYQEHEQEVREACAELINFKKFTLASEIQDDDLVEWTSSEWFMERVFDHFMINEVSLRQESSGG